MRKYLGFMFPMIVVIIKIVVSVLSLPYDIDSVYDEGFLMLSVHNVMHGGIGGSSLWANMAIALLGERVCYSMLSLRIANLVLSVVSGLLFWLITFSKVTKNRLSSTAYLVMVMFVLLPIGGIILNYNGFSRFFLLLVCAASFRLFYDDKKIGLWAILGGFALAMAFFSILPSSVMVGGTVSVLLVIRYWKEWQKMFKLFGMMVLGAVAAFMIVHFFVADLKEVYVGMMETARTITKVDRGYDPLSFCLKTLLYFRDISFCLLTSIGIIVVALFLKRNGCSWLAFLFYVVAFILYWHYQEKPSLSLGMQLSVLWLHPLIIKWFGKELPSIRQLFSFDFVFNLFLCFFPVLAVLGTNLPLGVKIGWFIVPWALLTWRLGIDEENRLLRRELLFAISIVLLIGTVQQAALIDSKQTIVDRGSLKGMRLNLAQEEHFKGVEDIMNKYHYCRGESVVFSTQLSMATLCYLESIPCGLFFQPMDFVAHASDNLPQPDFLFLCEFDTIIAKEKLKEMPWGWPGEFDVYEVGSPDDANQTDYPIERSLYCRRCLRRNM